MQLQKSGDESILESAGIGAGAAEPDITVLSNGNLLVTWSEVLGQPTDEFDDVDGAVFARILDAAQDFGAQVCMTSPEHPSGTDRLQQVATQMGWPDEQIVVNVQGDEPLIPPAIIDQVAANLAQHPGAGIATLCAQITGLEELLNPNIVKVVRSAQDMALYFSRATIPWPRDAFARSTAAFPGAGAWYRHIGIYAYRTGFLHQYVTWPSAPPEQLEQLEQLRALYNGVGIHVAPAREAVPAGVDTPQDLLAVRSLLGSAACE